MDKNKKNKIKNWVNFSDIKQGFSNEFEFCIQKWLL